MPHFRNFGGLSQKKQYWYFGGLSHYRLHGLLSDNLYCGGLPHSGITVDCRIIGYMVYCQIICIAVDCRIQVLRWTVALSESWWFVTLTVHILGTVMDCRINANYAGTCGKAGRRENCRCWSRVSNMYLHTCRLTRIMTATTTLKYCFTTILTFMLVKLNSTNIRHEPMPFFPARLEPTVYNTLLCARHEPDPLSSC